MGSPRSRLAVWLMRLCYAILIGLIGLLIIFITYDLLWRYSTDSTPGFYSVVLLLLIPLVWDLYKKLQLLSRKRPTKRQALIQNVREMWIK